MEHITICRFCEKTSINCDHGNCAKGYAQRLQKKVLDHIERNPSEPLPKKIQEEYSSPQWKWYLEYLDLEARSIAIKSHMEGIKEKILVEAKQILSMKSNMRKFERQNITFDSFKFTFQIDVSVTVTPERLHR